MLDMSTTTSHARAELRAEILFTRIPRAAVSVASEWAETPLPRRSSEKKSVPKRRPLVARPSTFLVDAGGKRSHKTSFIESPRVVKSYSSRGRRTDTEPRRITSPPLRQPLPSLSHVAATRLRRKICSPFASHLSTRARVAFVVPEEVVLIDPKTYNM